MPRGPCAVCGETDYPLSMGGPTICPSCDCGIDPKLRKAEKATAALIGRLVRTNEYLRSLVALKAVEGPTIQGEISANLAAIREANT